MKATKKNKSPFSQTLERIGNKIPHPIYIFLILIAIIMVVSAICAHFGVSVTYDAANKNGEIEQTTVAVVNLLSKAQLQNWLINIPEYFKSATTIMTIMTLVLCMSIAEYSGFFEAALRHTLMKTPRAMVTFVLSVIGICCNLLADAGTVLAASLGAMAFLAIGRNPVMGLMIGYASAAAGYTANLFPSATDVTLNSVTEPIAESLGMNSNLLSNWYFMIATTLVLGAVTTFVAEKFLAKLFDDDKGAQTLANDAATNIQKTSPEELKGLKAAGITAIIMVVVVLAMIIPKNGFLRADDGSILPASPFIKGLVPIIGLFFVGLGIAYGTKAGTIKHPNDVPKMMAKGVATYGSLVVVLFFASQMISLFNTSKLGTIIAVRGQVFLTTISLSGLPLLIVFTLIVTLINLFMASNAAKWYILGPVFIPMFASMGIHPAWTQLAYRIGDSCTNNITPVMSGFVICLSLMEKYIKKNDDTAESSVGTFFAAQLPFSIAYLITFIVLMAVFFLLGLPIGIGV